MRFNKLLAWCLGISVLLSFSTLSASAAKPTSSTSPAIVYKTMITVSGVNGNTSLASLYTPSQSGIYRISIVAIALPNANVPDNDSMSFSVGTDVNGQCSVCGPTASIASAPKIVQGAGIGLGQLSPDTPLQWVAQFGDAGDPNASTYNVYIVIERLW